MNYLLKAKPWQLFLLIFAIPLVIVMIFEEPLSFNNSFGINDFITLLAVGFLLCWYWSIAIHFHKQAQMYTRLNVWIFKAIMTAVFSFIIFASLYSNLVEQETVMNESGIISDSFYGSLIFNAMTMFCLLYCLNFIAKTLKTAELKRKVVLKDYIKDLFMLWFYPIGILIIQPRINKLLEESI